MFTKVRKLRVVSPLLRIKASLGFSANRLDLPANTAFFGHIRNTGRGTQSRKGKIGQFDNRETKLRAIHTATHYYLSVLYFPDINHQFELCRMPLTISGGSTVCASQHPFTNCGVFSLLLYGENAHHFYFPLAHKLSHWAACLILVFFHQPAPELDLRADAFHSTTLPDIPKVET